MKRILIVFILSSLCSLFLQAEIKPVKLVSIDLKDITKLEKLESMNLIVIDQTSDELISYINDFQSELLSTASIRFNLLSNKLQLDDLMLVSAKKNKKLEEMSINSKKILGLSGNSIIVSVSPDTNLDNNLKVIPVKKINRTFKNSRIVYNSIQSNALDELINTILDSVDSNSVRNYIQELQDFGTRFLRHPNRKDVALWIKKQFELMSYTEVELDSFIVGGYMQYNVVATFPARAVSDKYIVIGGHHDSITQQSLSNTTAPAPGADDNASGTTAVLESARALMESNFQSDVNIKFVTFAAEELGLYGGFDYAEKAAASGMDIQLMINHDMISSTRRSIESSVVDINYYTGSDAFRQLAFESVEKYTMLNAEYGSPNSAGSDSYAFYSNGFYSVYFEESDFSNFYHTSNDLIDNYSMTFCSEVIKASLATLISNAVTPSVVNNFTIINAGDGSSLQLDWDANTDADIAGYKVFVGISPGNYGSEYEVNDTSFLVTGLTEGIQYYLGIAAVDQDGFESFIVERSKTTNSLPKAPSDFKAEATWHSVTLTWAPNDEIDLAGYNAYRSGIDTDEIVKLNDQLITDVTFLDNTTEVGVFYEYKVCAVDKDNNESTNTEYIISRAVSLDQNLLLVIETVDGDGSLYSPTFEETSSYYKDLLREYDYELFNAQTVEKVSLAYLGAYKNIIWVNDDESDLRAGGVSGDIAKFLNYGGNLFYAGFKAASNFSGPFGTMGNFSKGNFLFDYFKIEKAEYRFISKFSGALSLANGYSDLLLDESKLTSTSDNHIRNVEVIWGNSKSQNIYAYNSDYDSTSTLAILKGKPVGVEYLGNDYKTIILSVPLYYVESSSATALIDYVLQDKFGLTTGIESDEVAVPSSFSLMQNYPNPFNPSTRIKYQVASIEKVSLKVYDILGNEIATLVNQLKSPGTYEVNFEASELSSGIYFYRLISGSFVQTRKMMFIK